MDQDVSPTADQVAPARANLLNRAASSYLRSAQHQPVRWHAWGGEAFQRAQDEDKPVLLDVGAVWCHWCHVMDRESYEDAEIAAIINEHFVAVKVDRDERPDVDARYQAAVSAISGQGGWPLTAFLTPDGKPYFGGTYFPREERYGRPGFGRVLLTMAKVWREQREEAIDSAGSVMAAIEQNEAFSGRDGAGSEFGEGLTLSLVDRIGAAAIKQFDPRHGGFGSQPKFPHPAVLDLLLELAMNRGNDEARTVFCTTLEKMARGGMYDQLAGGFHRYSVDERWVVPHFEKMLYDNTELLRNYVHGFQSFMRADFLDTAVEIMRWLDACMTDRERGGFYASQDADIHLEDDGDYFTWTLEEARASLDAAELEVAASYWDIGELGDMHHNPARNVLHVKQSLAELGASMGKTEEQLRPVLDAARRKLLAARKKRPTPFIDQTIYTGWNAMAIRAYLETARVLRMDSAWEFGLRTLNRLLAEAWDGGETLHHVIAYPRGLKPSERVPGTLDDYAFTVHACIDGWMASGEMRYYQAAVNLADAMIARFYDPAAGAFHDTALREDGRAALGALAARRMPLQDSPTPAGNPVAAAALLRLEALNGRMDFRAIAEKTLAQFAGIVEHFGLYAGAYGLALERMLLDPVQVVVVGSGPEAARLEALAVTRFAVNKTVMRIAPFRLVPGGVPEVLAETLLQVPRPESATAWALVCLGRTCLPPITTTEALLEALEPAV